MKHLLTAWALLAAPASALAQSAPVNGYDFLTVAELEGPTPKSATLLFAPAFAGTTALPLAPLLGGAKYMATYRQNLELVNQQLAALTAAGWELVQLSTTFNDAGHTYLFRRPKK